MRLFVVSLFLARSFECAVGVYIVHTKDEADLLLCCIVILMLLQLCCWSGRGYRLPRLLGGVHLRLVQLC
jgi:hypothetical protein